MFTPAAILLTRQKTAVLERMEDFDPRDMLRGAYIVRDFSYELDERQPTLRKIQTVQV